MPPLAVSSSAGGGGGGGGWETEQDYRPGSRLAPILPMFRVKSKLGARGRHLHNREIAASPIPALHCSVSCQSMLVLCTAPAHNLVGSDKLRDNTAAVPNLADSMKGNDLKHFSVFIHLVLSLFTVVSPQP